MMRITKAEAKRAGLEGRILFPKPKARCKHRWRATVTRVGSTLVPGKRCTAGCEGVAPMKVRKPLRAMSAKTRRRVLGWGDLKRRVYEMCGGICFWCGKPCAFEVGTIEHADPGGLDHEVNYNWVHHLPFMGSCHDRKGRHPGGIVAAMAWTNWRYLGPALARTASEFAETVGGWAKGVRIIQRHERREIQRHFMREIESGKRPAMLPASK